ncbi:carbamoyltransferase HypF [Nitrosophilus alvini]|uniref:carbamoyltransferase HypF n=1 Tax=Nitrosophilus alvini TaxID=2714855 RepID=UPI001F16C8DD|nr:carbamoyltransferase HypF [Nitrosophilus alvini]
MRKIRAVIKINGIVQGVGFRPFIYKLAKEYYANGFVMNDAKGVLIDIDIEDDKIDSFLKAISYKKPSLARIDEISYKTFDSLQRDGFFIKESCSDVEKSAAVSPDIAVCENCLEEMRNPQNRRYQYYFINCTDCGPRYTITRTVPFDRKNTSMAEFEMCPKCKEEYEDPLDRRYHAQAISCFDCGPGLCIKSKKGKTFAEGIEAIKMAAKLLKKGKIVAVKGLGGFHLMCDATNARSVKTLRQRKNRQSKPFAVMFRNLDQIERVAELSERERELILSKEKPIVIVKKRKIHRLECYKYKLAACVAPEIDRLGVFLPYTPLQHILFEYYGCPLVATSANMSDEPIITDSEDLLKRLGNVIDFYIDYNREIVNACDDSVIQCIDDKKETVRLARGFAPKTIKLPFSVEKNILAVGANQKNSITIAIKDKLIMSPHIGDLNTIESFGYFEKTVDTFKRFYDFEPDIIVCDKHPGYETTKWAVKETQKREGEVELLQVQHHLAHIYACKAELGIDEDCLGFSWDGTGYGDDGNIWGGEVFKGDERAYHFKYFRLIGGEKAVKEPRRAALGLLFEIFSLDEILEMDNPTVKAFSKEEIKLLHQAYEKGLNSPLTSSAGRIFDAVASFAGIIQESGYEGQSGLIIEKLYNDMCSDSYKYEIKDGIIDISQMIRQILTDLNAKNCTEKNCKCMISTKFLNTMKNIIVNIAKKENMPVILSGGVFQNRILSENVIKEFEKEGIRYYFQHDTPINDGGISLGQIWYILSKYSK